MDDSQESSLLEDTVESADVTASADDSVVTSNDDTVAKDDTATASGDVNGDATPVTDAVADKPAANLSTGDAAKEKPKPAKKDKKKSDTKGELDM